MIGQEQRSRSRRFSPRNASVRAVRQFVDETLQSWAVDPDPGVLLASELATNAVLHARTEFTVCVSRNDVSVRVEVGDQNPRMPTAPPPLTGATSGYGLQLVAQYATTWGVERQEDGKVVFFEVPATSPPTSDRRSPAGPGADLRPRVELRRPGPAD